ncbi:MAG TPA: hypothetical protein VMH00_09300 [Candidatus Limnocylindrales bacterium]|nr:hypothetical protein [Candidatus Limnocylindrales bacterium]
MKTISGVLGKARIGKGAVTVLAVLFILQAYFVRELLAAELLFALGFVVVLALVAVFYAIGAASEFGLDWAEAGVRSVRRGYAMLEEISRKPFRHPRSESAQ